LFGASDLSPPGWGTANDPIFHPIAGSKARNVVFVSPDESIMIFTLAVVLVTYHLTGDEYVGVDITAGPLSVMVNAIPGNDHADFCVNLDYLGHALVKYRDILKRRWSWGFDVGKSDALLVGPIGHLPKSTRGCKVKLPFVDSAVSDYIV
jgi:hypothetical protein